MTREIITENLAGMLENFKKDDDSLMAMLKYICKYLMEVEVNHQLCSDKGKHSPERTGYCSGYGNRRFDTRLGTIELEVPKVRNGGYAPFLSNTDSGANRR